MILGCLGAPLGPMKADTTFTHCFSRGYNSPVHYHITPEQDQQCDN